MRASEDLAGSSVFCSWSGGKDSALALHEAVVAGAVPRLLLTMMSEAGERSRSHGLARRVLEAQAAAIGLPIRFGAASWSGYEREFVRLIEREAVARGATIGVFGDIDIEDHRAWVESACARAGAAAWLPLWRRGRRQAVADLLAAGFQAVIVAVRDGALSPDLLGETIDATAVRTFERAGVDLAGEHGEYHTIVVDGPLFHRPLALSRGERHLRDGMWFLDVDVARADAGAPSAAPPA